LCSPAKAPTAHRRPKNAVEKDMVLFISEFQKKKKKKRRKRGREREKELKKREHGNLIL
jgi:hypothetical protein